MASFAGTAPVPGHARSPGDSFAAAAFGAGPRGQTHPPRAPRILFSVGDHDRTRPRVGRPTGRLRRRGQRRGATRARTICAPPRRSARVRLPVRLTPSPETVLNCLAGTPTPVGALSGRRGAHAIAVAPWRPGRFAGDSVVPAPHSGAVRHADGLP